MKILDYQRDNILFYKEVMMSVIAVILFAITEEENNGVKSSKC